VLDIYVTAAAPGARTLRMMLHWTVR